MNSEKSVFHSIHVVSCFFNLLFLKIRYFYVDMESSNELPCLAVEIRNGHQHEETCLPDLRSVNAKTSLCSYRDY